MFSMDSENYTPEFIVPPPPGNVTLPSENVPHADGTEGTTGDLPDLNNISGVVDDGSTAKVDWPAIMEKFFDYMDYWTKEEMAFNQSSADKSMLFNAEQSAIERDFNKEEAQKNRDWQEYMSNTSYQRAVEDMRKAGLNPMLLAAKSGGAITPAGSSAVSNSARSSGNANVSGLHNYLPNLLKSIGSMYNSVAGTLAWSLDQLGLGDVTYKNGSPQWK